MIKVTGFIVMGILLSWAGLSVAEPVAKLPPLTSVAKQGLAAKGKTEADMLKDLPSKKMVGIPIYPDSYFASQGGGNNDLSMVMLMSKNSPKEIISWYQKNLGAKWQNFPKLANKDLGQLAVFVNTEKKNIDVMESFKHKQVIISKVEKPEDTGFAAMLFDVTGIKSMISITVKPLM